MVVMAMVAMIPGAAMIIIPIIVAIIVMVAVVVIMVVAARAVDLLQVLLVEIEGGGLLDRSCGLVAKYAE